MHIGNSYGVSNSISIQSPVIRTIDDAQLSFTGSLVSWTQTKEREEELKMNYLFSVIVVNENGDIDLDTKVVAKDEEAAKFKSGTFKYLTDRELTSEDVTVLVNRIAPVKVKENKKNNTVDISEVSMKKFEKLLGSK